MIAALYIYYKVPLRDVAVREWHKRRKESTHVQYARDISSKEVREGSGGEGFPLFTDSSAVADRRGIRHMQIKKKRHGLICFLATRQYLRTGRILFHGNAADIFFQTVSYDSIYLQRAKPRQEEAVLHSLPQALHATAQRRRQDVHRRDLFSGVNIIINNNNNEANSVVLRHTDVYG